MLILNLKFCENLDDEVFVIGGSEIYKALEPYCTKLVITHVLKKFDGDAFFTIDLSDDPIVYFDIEGQDKN